MDAKVKEYIITTLTDKLIELIDALEGDDSVKPKQLQQLFELFKQLEDQFPQQIGIALGADDAAVIMEYLQQQIAIAEVMENSVPKKDK